MKIKVFLLAVALIVGVAGAPQSAAVTSVLSMQVRQTPSASETLLTMYGNLKPNKSGITVKIQVDTLRNKNKIDIKTIPKVSHDDMCNLLNKWKKYICLEYDESIIFGCNLDCEKYSKINKYTASLNNYELYCHNENYGKRNRCN
jgi:hypothetical protein